MTRYGVCLILENGEVSLPEGRLGGDVFFFSHCLSEMCFSNIHLCVFSHSGISAAPGKSQTAQESSMMDSVVHPRG